MRFCPRCATPLEERLFEGIARPTCPRCDYIYYRDPKVAVAVLVGQDHKVLLVQRNHDPKRGLWTFPSGYVNAGELVEEAARREAVEEAGVEVELNTLVAVLSEPGNPVVLVVYSGSIVGGVLAPGIEATAVGFFPLDALPALAFDHDLDLIRAWERGGTLPLQNLSPTQAT